MHYSSITGFISFFFLLVFVASEPAQAYIDPATGSMAMQVILGSLAAGYLFLRERVHAFFYSIKKMFSGQKD